MPARPHRSVAVLLLLLPLCTRAGRAQPARTDRTSPAPPPAAWVAVDRAVWPRLDSLRTPQRLAASRAAVLEQLAGQAGGTIALDPTLARLTDTVVIGAGVTLRRAMREALERTTLQLLVDPAAAAFVVLERRGRVRRVRVVDADTDRPLPGAEVLVPRLARSVRTSDAGVAVLGDLGDDDVPVLVRAVGFAAVRDTSRLARDAEVRLHAAPPSLAEVVVTPGSRRALESPLALGLPLSREDAAARPQIGEDLLRAINRQPGVTTNDFSAAFSVRGARPDEVLVLLDGMPLRDPYHLKDIGAGLSILDVHATGGVELTPGSFTSEYGDRLTGVMTITPRDPAPGERLWSAGVSATWLRALAGGRTRDGRFAWLTSVRRGYLDLIFDLTGFEGDFTVRYADGLARATWRPGAHDAVSATLLGATDALSQTAQFDAPPFGSRYRSRYGWLTWVHDGARLTGQTVIGHAVTNRTRRASGGAGPAALGRLDDARTLDFTPLRTSWTVRLSPRFVVRAGAEGQWQAGATRYERVRPTVATLNGFETRTDTLRVRLDTTGVVRGAWIAPRWQRGAFVAEVGVRTDAWTWTDPVRWQPRANLSWSPSARTTVRAALGRYAQAQPLDGLPVEQGVRVWSPVEAATHAALGIDQRVGRGMQLRVDGYERRLAPVTPRVLDLAGSADITRDLRFTNRLITAERGRARGVELSLAGEAGARLEWGGWYALSEVVDRIDGRWQPRAIDQRHAGAVDVAWRTDDRRWRASVALVLHSGWPVTPVTVRVDTLRVNGRPRPLAVVDYGAYNADRLPTYARLDVRLLRRYQTTHGQWTAFVDLFNVLGRRNPLGYDAQIQSAQPLVWRRTQADFVPRIPTFGVSWER